MRKFITRCALIAALPFQSVLAWESAKVLDILAGAAPLSVSELARYTGPGSVEASSVGIALVEGNGVGTGSVTGGNYIVHSLNGTAVFSTVFQNTGNNSLFQSVTTQIITLQLRRSYALHALP